MILSHRHITTDIAQMQTHDASQRSTSVESVLGQDSHMQRFCATTNRPGHLSFCGYGLKECQEIVAHALQEIVPISLRV